MSNYIGRYAELYDTIYQDRDYVAEVDMVDSWIKAAGVSPRLLELACGTGTHALKLAALGYKVTAIDNSPTMLGQARMKVQEAGANITLLEMDMLDIGKLDGPFGSVVSFFDSIGYVLTDERVLQVLTSSAGLLEENGIMIFEYWHGPAMIAHYEHHRERNFSFNGYDIHRTSQTELNKEEQTCSVKYTLEGTTPDGPLHHEETQHNRFFNVEQMAQLVSNAGMTVQGQYAGFSTNEAITDETFHVVCVARK